MPATRPVLLAGAREFNSGRYFEAHEALEEGLEEIDEADWDLGVGLIQIAVGYHKATQKLWSGALLLWQRGLEKLAPLPADAGGLRLEDLRARVRRDVEHVESGDFAAVDLQRDPPRMQFGA
jgi:hypothetical protein